MSIKGLTHGYGDGESYEGNSHEYGHGVSEAWIANRVASAAKNASSKRVGSFAAKMEGKYRKGIKAVRRDNAKGMKRSPHRVENYAYAAEAAIGAKKRK